MAHRHTNSCVMEVCGYQTCREAGTLKSIVDRNSAWISLSFLYSLTQISRHYFKTSFKAVEVACRIRKMKENRTTSDRTASNSTKIF